MYYCYVFDIFFPAAEVVEQDKNEQQKNSVTPSPMLSPSSTSDEDSIYYSSSPNTIALQLDDLFDWDAQQIMMATTTV